MHMAPPSYLLLFNLPQAAELTIGDD